MSTAYEQFEMTKRQLHAEERQHVERLAAGGSPTDAHRAAARRLVQPAYDANWRRWQRDAVPDR
jgi:hypothetical protein